MAIIAQRFSQIWLQSRHEVQTFNQPYKFMATHYKPNIEIWQKKFLTFALISLHFSKKLIFNVAFW
jgi:hypothetical protein